MEVDGFVFQQTLLVEQGHQATSIGAAAGSTSTTTRTSIGGQRQEQDHQVGAGRDGGVLVDESVCVVEDVSMESRLRASSINTASSWQEKIVAGLGRGSSGVGTTVDTTEHN